MAHHISPLQETARAFFMRIVLACLRAVFPGALRHAVAPCPSLPLLLSGLLQSPARHPRPAFAASLGYPAKVSCKHLSPPQGPSHAAGHVLRWNKRSEPLFRVDPAPAQGYGSAASYIQPAAKQRDKEAFFSRGITCQPAVGHVSSALRACPAMPSPSRIADLIALRRGPTG